MGCREEVTIIDPRVHAAALAGTGGALTVIVANDGLEAKVVRLSGVPGRRLFHYWYDATLPDGLQGGMALPSGSPEVAVTVKPLSVNAITSWEWDRLKP